MILDVKNLKVSFPLRGKVIEAVRGISFGVEEGEAVGIVGESGSGKSVAVQRLLGLVEGKVEGEAWFEGENLLQMREEEWRSVRGVKIGMVFQDPLTSLNPTMKLGAQVMEGLVFHGLAKRHEGKQQALEWLRLVRLPDPETRFDQYPHQLSGGMRQRALIAIALACHPHLLIADESTTALDTVTQAQILTLLKDLQKQLQMTLLVITHDFGVVAEICTRILVFQEGKLVEEGPIDQILYAPKHPYTQMLLSCVPKVPNVGPVLSEAQNPERQIAANAGPVT